MERNLQYFARKEIIEDTLLALLETTPYAKISVVDIAEKAGICRKCYYNYFTGKDACLDSLIDRIVLEAGIYVNKANAPEASTLQRYMNNLEYWKTQRVLLHAVGRDKLEQVFFQRCMAHYAGIKRRIETSAAAEDIALDEDIIYFCVSGHMGLLMRWCDRGFDTPVDILAAKFIRLYESALVNLKK